MRVLFGNGRLPDVARRQVLRARGLKFHQRLLIFFVLFLIAFGAYMMAFVTASDWGVDYGEWCLAVSAGIGQWVSGILVRIPSDGVQKIGEGITRMLSNQLVAVIMTSALLSGAVAIAASLLVWLRSFIGIVRGGDGSHAEIYDSSTEGTDSPDGRDAETDGYDIDYGDDGQWATEIVGNPYSRVPA